MSNNSDYLDRLRNIREKYGCSQPKGQSAIPQLHYGANRNLGIEKPLSTFQRSDHYALQKTKYADISTHPSSTLLSSKHNQYKPRPQSSAGLSAPNYAGLGDLSKRLQRQRQIQQIRQNYAASRKKVIDDFSNKGYTRQSSKQLGRDHLTKAERDYLRQKDYTKQYGKYRKDEYRQTQIPLTATKIDLINGGYLGHQSISPIKRMSQFQDKKSYRYKETQNQDTFWRQRQAKLSQLTSNRLNETNRLAPSYKDEKALDSKYYPAKHSGIYSESIKTYGNQIHGIAKMDLQNKMGDYSVTNIDRIQNRIQSILGKK